MYLFSMMEYRGIVLTSCGVVSEWSSLKDRSESERESQRKNETWTRQIPTRKIKNSRRQEIIIINSAVPVTMFDMIRSACQGTWEHNNYSFMTCTVHCMYRRYFIQVHMSRSPCCKSFSTLCLLPNLPWDQTSASNSCSVLVSLALPVPLYWLHTHPDRQDNIIMYHQIHCTPYEWNECTN